MGARALGDMQAALPPEPGEAMGRIHSAALNRLDLFVSDGLPGHRLTFPHVVGSDGAGGDPLRQLSVGPV